MHFLDEAKIFVRSGNGGAGCVSFRREKFIEFGGPNGGDGGKGGDIIFETVPGLNTLIDFRYHQHFKGKKGGNGKGSNKDGRNGLDTVIKVPMGTQLYDGAKEVVLYDLIHPHEKIVFLKGGRGGKGNAHFKSSTNQAPRFAQPGEEGTETWVWLRLKLLADVGLIGLPNAGKSTFLSVVSRAKPKIADYPFTTLVPKLGVVKIPGQEREFVLADLPGLIEGAHLGKGLGHRFLAHVERCTILLHLIEATGDDPAEAYGKIRSECADYSPELCTKPELVVLTKADLLTHTEGTALQKTFRKKAGFTPHLISSHTREGIEPLIREIGKILSKNGGK